jgi:hypothetical protein
MLHGFMGAPAPKPQNVLFGARKKPVPPEAKKTYTTVIKLDPDNSVDADKSRGDVLNQTASQLNAFKNKLEAWIKKNQLESQVKITNTLSAIGTLLIEATASAAARIKRMKEVGAMAEDGEMQLIAPVPTPLDPTPDSPILAPSRLETGNPGPVTFEEAKQLKAEIPNILLGQSGQDLLQLHKSKFKINGIGIGREGQDFLVSINTLNESGKKAVLKTLSKQAGFEDRGNSGPYQESLVAIAFNGKQVPIRIQVVGSIVAF